MFVSLHILTALAGALIGYRVCLFNNQWRHM